MKKFTIAILTILMVFAGYDAKAQGKWGADSANCVKYISFYKEYYKQKNYTDAFPSWRNAYRSCPPTASQNLIIDGTNMIRSLIAKNSNNPVVKAGLVDTLMTLHDIRVEYYPKSAVKALNTKGVDMSNYIDDNKKLHEGYSAIIEANKGEVNPKILIWDFYAALELYKNGQIDAEDILATYQKNIETLEKIPSDENTQNIKTDIESLFINSKIATCEDLVALFEPRFNATPDDITLVTNIVKMLSITEDCQGNDLYLNAVTSLYKLDPSYNSAYFLARLNIARGNNDEALRYLDEAIAYPESDAATDAAYSYEAAQLCYKNGRLSKAYGYANAAINGSSEFTGRSYFLMGLIWGSINCGGDEIEKRAHFWVACDYLAKAKAADSSLADECDKYIGRYRVYFPQTAEAFMYNYTDGQAYKVVCSGMSATTTVRTRK